MSYTQDDRLMSIDTPLGKDKLLLTGFSGSEGISQLFEFEVSVLSENNSVSFDAIIGKSVTIAVALADGSKRYINGIVSEFAQGRGTGSETDASDPALTSYSFTMVPWTWLLTRTTDLRVLSPDPGTFEKRNVKDIVEKIFTEKGFTDYQFKLDRSYPKREYCLQYRETDFNFISRLMEEEGIYYYFEHKDGKHTMMIVDSASKHTPCPNQATAQVRVAEGSWYTEDGITAIEKVQRIRAGKYTLNDYNFRMPGTNLKCEVLSKKKLGPGEREFYDCAGLYQKKSDGDQLATSRMEEQEAWITRVCGTSVCRAFASGYRFKLKGHYRKDMETEYLLVSLGHSASQEGYRSGGGGEGEFSYSNYFTCIPYDVQYRPYRGTLKPLVHGSETATVVGPAGATNHTDEEHYGMVKVQFHWDREGQKDDKSSCWLRVAYPYAGEKHGMQFTPLVGDEVMVDFLQGDPDRPVITGSLFKGEHLSLIQPDGMIKNRILTPYGHHMIYDDKGASITLNTGGGQSINMQDIKGGGRVRINTANGHTVLLQKDGGVSCIQIVTEKMHSITLDDANDCIHISDRSLLLSMNLNTTSQEMTIGNLGSGKLRIIANGEMNIVSQGEMKIMSNTKISMQAPVVEIVGTGLATFSSNAVATVSSPMTTVAGDTNCTVRGTIVNVNGVATTNITGGLVKINC